MSRRTVELSEQAFRLADSLAERWNYEDASTVVEAALLEFARRMEDPEASRQRLTELVQTGIDDIEAGRSRRIRNSGDLRAMMESLRSEVDAELGKVHGS